MKKYLTSLAILLGLPAIAFAGTGTFGGNTISTLPSGASVTCTAASSGPTQIGITDSSWLFSQSPVIGDAWTQGSTGGVTTEFSDGCSNPPQSGLQVQGQEAVINFTGTGIILYGATGPSSGVGAYSVDGGALTTFDAYSASNVFPVALATVSGLSNASHTLTYQVTCNKASSSTGYYQTVAYYTLASGGSAHHISAGTAYSHAASNITLNGSSWACGSPPGTGAPQPPNGIPPSGYSTDLSGDHCWDGTSGDYVSFSFTGSCIEVYTRPDVGDGYWDAYIDGTKVATVNDQYSTVDNDAVTGYADFVYCGLSSGTHTFKAQVDGSAAYPSQSETGGLKNLLQFDEAITFP